MLPGLFSGRFGYAILDKRINRKEETQLNRLIASLTLIFLLIGAAGLIVSGQTENEEKELQLLCLNIGKADCMLLTYGDRHYLIDAGYAHTYPALSTALEQYGVDHLNGVFLTHCHKDHQGGLAALARSEVRVDAWYAPKIYFKVDGLSHAAADAAAIRGASVTWLVAGQTILVSEDAGFSVLGPITRDEENENNNSLVLRFSSPAGSILFTGDMKKDEADELLTAGLLAPCDLLKVGHHGDNKATTKDLVRAVLPKAAVIMTDSREETDTPAPSVLSRLADVGCKTYVTQDAHDAILFTLKNGEISSVLDIQWNGVPERITGLEISLSVENDALTILNKNGAAVKLEGCVLYSTKGDELLNMPEITLEPGQSYVIGTRKTEGQMDYCWDRKRVWSKTQLDTAIVYDAYGRILACTNNGMAE